jgi:hypothetical protein
VVALSNAAQGLVNTYRYDPSGALAEGNEGIDNGFRARGASGWVDDGNGLVFTGSQYQFPAVGLTLPAAANPAPPVPGIAPAFNGGGACLVQGVTACAMANARRDR